MSFRFRSSLFFAIFLLILLNLPLNWVESLRSTLVLYKATPPSFENKKEWALENALLRQQNQELRETLLSKESEKNHLKKLEVLCKRQIDTKELREFFKRRREEVSALLDLEFKSTTARVIQRDTSSWNRSFWINLGEKNNHGLPFPLIEINSPVLSGSYLIGVVEYVGKRRSRVRLLTDPSNVAAVRALRGNRKHRELFDLMTLFSYQIRLLCQGKEIGEKKQNVLDAITELSDELERGGIDRYLAKGELCGTTTSLWRSHSPTLKGVGFNYDFSDAEGVARDLRSGAPLSQMTGERMSLLKEGDLLVTTGLDGIFPPDIPVAVISKVFPLKEGSAWYDLEAKLCAGNLDAIEIVTVLPSRGRAF